jgi:hypothetical protein
VATATMTFACGGSVQAIVLMPVSLVVLHQPSPRDDFFSLVAVSFKRPDLCDRIDWRADASRGGIGTGAPYQFQTLRSACRRHLEGARDVYVPTAPFWMEEFAAQMRGLGYTDADVIQAAYAENQAYIHPVYRDLLANDEFRSRLRAAKGYGEPRDRARLRPATSLEFMYQMVAIDGPEAALCSKISPNATFYDLGGAMALLQSRCYLAVASNTRDIRLCEPLPAAGSFPHVNERYDSRELCRESVAIYSRPDYKGTLTSGHTPFPRAADFHSTLLEIGYRADALPPIAQPTPNDYWEFVSRLIFRGSASDRAEFLRRVETLE